MHDFFRFCLFLFIYLFIYFILFYLFIYFFLGGGGRGGNICVNLSTWLDTSTEYWYKSALIVNIVPVNGYCIIREKKEFCINFNLIIHWPLRDYYSDIYIQYEFQIHYTDFWFAEADFVSGSNKVTIGGDQLTRSHLDSAKILRAGAHTVVEKFGNLGPILEECFHIQQDLLEVFVNTFIQCSISEARFIMDLISIKFSLPLMVHYIYLVNFQKSSNITTTYIHLCKWSEISL